MWLKRRRNRAECVMRAGNGEGVRCKMTWLEDTKGRTKEKEEEKGEEAGGRGGASSVAVAAAKAAGKERDAVMDVSSARGFKCARVALRIPSDHSARTGFPSPPANPFWRFRLFLDRLYVPAMGSEDARSLRSSALDMARQSRLAKATPQYRRWLHFKVRGFRDLLCHEQIQSPAEMDDIFLESDEHVEHIRRRRREVRRGSDGRSLLAAAVASREVPVLGVFLPVLRLFDFNFRLRCDEARLRGRLSHKYFCRNDVLRMETELRRRRLYEDVLEAGDFAALAVDLTPLRPIPIRSFAKVYGARLKRGMMRLGATRERAEEKVNDLMDYFTIGSIKQLPLRGKLNLRGKEELAAVLKFYEELDEESKAAVRAASEATTATEQLQRYFSTIIGEESMATEKEIHAQRYKRMPTIVPDVDMMRDPDGDLYFPSESDHTRTKLDEEETEYREKRKAELMSGMHWRADAKDTWKSIFNTIFDFQAIEQGRWWYRRILSRRMKDPHGLQPPRDHLLRKVRLPPGPDFLLRLDRGLPLYRMPGEDIDGEEDTEEERKVSGFRIFCENTAARVFGEGGPLASLRKSKDADASRGTLSVSVDGRRAAAPAFADAAPAPAAAVVAAAAAAAAEKKQQQQQKKKIEQDEERDEEEDEEEDDEEEEFNEIAFRQGKYRPIRERGPYSRREKKKEQQARDAKEMKSRYLRYRGMVDATFKTSLRKAYESMKLKARKKAYEAADRGDEFNEMLKRSIGGSRVGSGSGSGSGGDVVGAEEEREGGFSGGDGGGGLRVAAGAGRGEGGRGARRGFSGGHGGIGKRSGDSVHETLSGLEGKAVDLNMSNDLNEAAYEALEEFKDTLRFTTRLGDELSWQDVEDTDEFNYEHDAMVNLQDKGSLMNIDKEDAVLAYDIGEERYGRKFFRHNPFPFEYNEKGPEKPIKERPRVVAEFDGITSPTFDDDAKYLRRADDAQPSGNVGGVVAPSRTTTMEDEKLWSMLGAVHGAQDAISVAMQNVSQTMNNDIPFSPHTKTPEAEDPYWKSPDPEAQQLAIEKADLVSAVEGSRNLEKTCVGVSGSCFTKLGGFLSAKWEPDHRLVIDYVVKDRTKLDASGKPKEIRVPICMIRDEYLCKSFFGLFIGPDAMDGGSKRKVGRSILKVLNGKSMLSTEDGAAVTSALPLSLGVFSFTNSIAAPATGGGAGDVFVLDGIARMKSSSRRRRGQLGGIGGA